MFEYLFLVILITLTYFWSIFVNIFYNFFFIYKSIQLIQKIKINSIDSIFIQDYIHIVNNAGVFAIKVVQWGLNRFKLMTENKNSEIMLEKLDIFYENCPYHSDDYTKKIFKLQFKFNISDKYEFNKIASGSIAQVYKLKDKQNNKEYAMKIVHPNVRNQINISKNIFEILLLVNKYIYKYKVSFDLKNFFTSIEGQINLVNEANYINKFYDKYKNNKYIVIPEIIEYSRDIIIMTYEEGIFYDELNISEYKKGKIISLLELFLLNSMIIDKFVHADLHNGNWKVRQIENSKEYQLIIYDFGLCLDLKNFHIEDFYKSIINYDYELLSEIISNGIVNIENKDKAIGIILNIIKKELDMRYMDMNKVVTVILKNCYKLDIRFDSDYLTFLLLTINFQSVASKYSHSGGASNDYKGEDVIQKDFMKKSMYPHMISFCKHYNIFDKLVDYFELFLSENKTDSIVFDDIDSRLKATLKNKEISFSDSDSDSDSDSSS